MSRTLPSMYSLVAALTLAGCTSSMGQSVHQNVDQDVAAGASPSVQIRNGAGSVRIEPSSGTRVHIHAIKSASSVQALRDIAIDVHIKGNTIAIASAFRGEGTQRGVSYVVRMPAGSSLDVRNGAGSIDVGRIAGNVAADTAAGSITADLGLVAGQRSVTLSTIAGGIRLSISARSSARIEAHSTVGSIGSDFSGLQQQRTNVVSASMEGSIGTGSGQIALTTKTGGIELRRTP